MPYDPERHHRRSTRYPGFDYASANAYFVTICTTDRTYLLSTIMDGTACIQPPGQAALKVWHGLPDRFPGLYLDAFVVMPNHVHGIVTIGYQPETAAPVSSAVARFIAPSFPTANADVGRPGAMNRAPTLGEVVRAFKAVSTRLIRTTVDPSFAWQRNYHDRIIRNDAELDRIIRNDAELDCIRQYIDDNPGTWSYDRENLAHMPPPASANATPSPYSP